MSKNTQPAVEQLPAQVPAPVEEQTTVSTEGAQKAELSKALAGKYKVIGTEPGLVHTLTHGVVDLRTIDLKTADALHATGKFQFLEPINPKTE